VRCGCHDILSNAEGAAHGSRAVVVKQSDRLLQCFVAIREPRAVISSEYRDQLNLTAAHGRSRPDQDSVAGPSRYCPKRGGNERQQAQLPGRTPASAWQGVARLKASTAHRAVPNQLHH
jgi:hypothetical protein